MMKYSTLLFLAIFIITCPNVLSQNNLHEEWLTRFEKTDYLETETYNETIQYFGKLAAHSPFAKLIKFGISPQGRDMDYFVVSKDKEFNPAGVKSSGKPVIFIVNGIHSGEIEGKDASMLLLRDILVTKEKANLIDNVVLIIIPIFSVDAHERKSKYNRINQNGPAQMGWRTTAQNLNLNRDWMKADAPEMRAMLKLFSDWLPDFFVDTHTTDGADYQYTITYDMETSSNVYYETAAWTKQKFIPFMEKQVEDAGFLIAPYLNFKGREVKEGISKWVFGPRFSQGYAAIQNRPGLLVETHMMKPYKARVFSTKAILEAVIKYINDNPSELTTMNKRADLNTVKLLSHKSSYLPLNFKLTPDASILHFKGIKYDKDSSWISGSTRVVYNHAKFETEIPYYDKPAVDDSVELPEAYIIPKEWGEWDNLIGRIKMHGIKVETVKSDTSLKVTRYKFNNIRFAGSPYESHQRVNCGYTAYNEIVKISKGDYIINTAQRTIRVIGNLLEPKAEDSFLQWGFFNSIFERKEYFESYVMEKVAREMLRDNPSLKREFEKKLASDKKFKNNPRARLNFFYERSPYYDNHLNVYPVMRVEK